MFESFNIPAKRFRKTAAATLALACASLAMVSGSVQAQGHGVRGGAGYHGGGHYGPGYGHGRGGAGWVWGGLGLGLGLGLASYYATPWYGYAEPRYVVVDPPVVYPAPSTTTVYSQPVPLRSPPQPVIYPRNGQSAAQTESDADACSQWAGQQPNATVDPSVFQRATQACMDGRGYTVR